MHLDECHAVMPIEIGGANGLVPLGIGSSKNFNIPVIDADWMGRAYPTAWQTTLCAHDPGNLTPCAIDGGDGNTIIMSSSSNDKMVDSILREGCVEMGSSVGAATKPSTIVATEHSGSETKNHPVGMPATITSPPRYGLQLEVEDVRD